MISRKRLRKASIRKSLCKNQKEKDQFKNAVKELLNDGEIIRDRGGILKKSAHVFINGTITVKEGAFGFIDIDESTESVFIPPGHTNGAFSGDLVKVQITDPGNSRGPVGKVVDIVEPAFEFLFGQLAEKNTKIFA